ncbi:Glycoside hydrolase family 76 protein [Mycena kentingensis (nom. inval.)]|nr:Glycoside hydrolase family 76 protein [Mycena kentingensis (nom. inval.)]
MILLPFLSFLVPVASAAIDASSWRSPSFNWDIVPRSHQAFAGLLQTMDVLHTPGMQFDGQNYEWYAQTFGQMADMEFVLNSTSFEAPLAENLGQTLRTRLAFQDTQSYGVASARAWFISNNATFRDWAVSSWEWAAKFTIVAGATKVDGKGASVSTQCGGATVAGGTFATTSSSDPVIGARATGYFALLSAILAQITADQKYLTAAVASITFVKNHLWNAENSVVQDSIAVDSCTLPSGGAALNSYNSALMLEALALVDELVVGMLGYKGWQTADGIVVSGAEKRGDGLVVRALGWAYYHGMMNDENKSYARNYIAVQYNAMLELATLNVTSSTGAVVATNVYAGQWTGPPPPPPATADEKHTADLANQTNAVSVLLAATWVDFIFPREPAPVAKSLALDAQAFVFSDSAASSSPSGAASAGGASASAGAPGVGGSGSNGNEADGGTGAGSGADSDANNTNANAATGTNNNAGPIAGGVVGGVLGLAALCACCFLCFRFRRGRRRRAREARDRDPNSPSYIKPFNDAGRYEDGEAHQHVHEREFNPLRSASASASGGAGSATPASTAALLRPGSTCSCGAHMHTHAYGHDTSRPPSSYSHPRPTHAAEAHRTSISGRHTYNSASISTLSLGGGASSGCAQCQAVRYANASTMHPWVRKSMAERASAREGVVRRDDDHENGVEAPGYAHGQGEPLVRFVDEPPPEYT